MIYSTLFLNVKTWLKHLATKYVKEKNNPNLILAIEILCSLAHLAGCTCVSWLPNLAQILPYWHVKKYWMLLYESDQNCNNLAAVASDWWRQTCLPSQRSSIAGYRSCSLAEVFLLLNLRSIRWDTKMVLTSRITTLAHKKLLSWHSVNAALWATMMILKTSKPDTDRTSKLINRWNIITLV